jgi:hypothetical protein
MNRSANPDQDYVNKKRPWPLFIWYVKSFDSAGPSNCRRLHIGLLGKLAQYMCGGDQTE